MVKRIFRDINSKEYDIDSILEGAVFDKLDMSDMDFAELPEVLSTCTVRELNLCGCEKLSSLKNLPNGVEYLNLNRCYSLFSLEGCPEGVKVLYCSGSHITSLKGLPESLKILICDETHISSLKGCPKGVEYINSSSCEFLTSLRGCPRDLKELNCEGCRELPTLEGLAEGLKAINCSVCESLTSLKGCPKSVRRINCSYTDIESLDYCPKGIKKISCWICYKLKYIPDYIPNEAIKSIPEEDIAKYKDNWLVEQKRIKVSEKQKAEINDRFRKIVIANRYAHSHS